MLIYHPAYDINHSIYRLLLILDSTVHESLHWDLLKLIDFYVLFPQVIKDIKPFPSNLRAYRQLINNIPDAYELMPNKKRILFELSNIQHTAVQNLIAKDLISVTQFKRKIITRTPTKLPSTLDSIIKDDYRKSEEWFRFVINELPTAIFTGKDGLKSRSGLMEYRYDV